MGFPIQLIAVVNPNDIVHRTFKSGDLSLAKDVKTTWASAMDIQVRSLYRESSEDSATIFSNFSLFGENTF